MIIFNSNVLKFGGFWLGFGSSPTPPQPTIYHINVPTVQHGTVAVNPTEGPTGTLVTISTVPDTGYELDTISLTGAELINGNQFYIDGSDVTVNVTFKEHASSTVIYKDDGTRHRSNWSTPVNMDTGNRYISLIIEFSFLDYAGTVNFTGDGKSITFGRFGFNHAGNTDMMKLASGVSSFTFWQNPPSSSSQVIYGNNVVINTNGASNSLAIQPNVYNMIFDTVENTMTIYLLDSDAQYRRSEIDIPNTPSAMRGTAQLTFNPKLITEINAADGIYQGNTYSCSLYWLSIKSFDNLNDALAFKGEYSA